LNNPTSLWTYAWDLESDGVENVLKKLSDLGVTSISLASSYHSGFFIHSHNKNHKMYFAEDGVVYFHPEMKYFEETSIKPKPAKITQHNDWFELISQNLSKYDLELWAWTVCNHNTRLGLLNPEAVITNVFGDKYFHILCPSNTDVRSYVIGLVKNLVYEYSVSSIQFESLGFHDPSGDILGLNHGHHHERYGTVLGKIETMLMSLCFCFSCQKQAELSGLDFNLLKESILNHMTLFFNSAPIVDISLPDSVEDLFSEIPLLVEFEKIRKNTVATLCEQIRNQLPKNSSTKLFMLEKFDPDVSKFVDAFYISVYGKSFSEAYNIVANEKKSIPENSRLFAGISLGFNSFFNSKELIDVTNSVIDAGAYGVNYYNYSESPKRVLDWLKPAIDSIK
tara:strand:- start:71686 stop:72867 length:1182 start_codon:yes stop_codon:yes gene_type:complete